VSLEPAVAVGAIRAFDVAAVAMVGSEPRDLLSLAGDGALQAVNATAAVNAVRAAADRQCNAVR
jgi:hypothetical protein